MRVPVALYTGRYDYGPAWKSSTRCDWGQVVGRRVRLLRQREGLLIWELAEKLNRADGRPYSDTFVSRLERGFASPPLWVYVQLANIFGVSAGRLLGPEEMESDLSESELTLVRVARELGLQPEEAIARLVRPG